MAALWRKPLLVGGIGLSFVLWLLSSLHHSLMRLDEWSVLSVIGLGTGFWLWNRQKTTPVTTEVVEKVDREMLDRSLAQVNTLIEHLETEAPEQNISEFKQQSRSLVDSLNRQTLKIAIAGRKGVGKSTLKPLLEQLGKEEKWTAFEALETEPLLVKSAEDSVQSLIEKNADLVLLITTGDLTESELRCIESFQQFHQKVWLLFNKQDQYLPEERAEILQQLRSHLQGLIAPEDVVGIAAAPGKVKVRKYKEDGSVTEWMESQQPELTALSSRLPQILVAEKKALVLATTWRQAKQLQVQLKTNLNAVRRERALPIIEKYQWVAAATAFANPVPALDLLATAAVSGQIVVDLAKVYQQTFSLSQAQAAAGSIGKLMIKLGVVELSTQTIGTILKGHAFTYVAGGIVQGVSAAYLTRLAGLSLVEYFQEQEVAMTAEGGVNLETLTEKLQVVFKENQRTEFIQGFVKKAVARLSPKPAT